MIIRIFLIASILVASWWLLQGRTTGLRLAATRAGAVVFAAAAVVAVLAPGLVTDVAHVVGVQEGPNLLLYVLIVVFAFTTLAQTARIRHLDSRLARLARAQALLEAEIRAGAEARVDG
ncbi:MAG TPA: DUF2304 domain-containing protein [Nocardioides sp.]|nr:DUF2304 domain-containing protein [Nocardioides sp.]